MIFPLFITEPNVSPKGLLKTKLPLKKFAFEMLRVDAKSEPTLTCELAPNKIPLGLAM